MWLGNRGCLHTDAGEIVRPFQLKRWIYCQLSFKERRRTLMMPGRYTELFFLDEATALAAGHRPCAECQRHRYNEFLDGWGQVHPGGRPRADAVDAILHGERITATGKQRSYLRHPTDLPDGVMLMAAGTAAPPYLLWNRRLFPWSPYGYGPPSPLATAVGQVRVLTPPSTVAVLQRGFALTVHPTAAGQIEPGLDP